MNRTRRWLLAVPAGLLGATALQSTAVAASAAQISRGADSALHALYAAQPKARELGQRAKAILIFPKIIKAGLIIGGQSGDGVLRVGGKTNGFYNISAASFGLQAGVQWFSYALFFMDPAALQFLDKSDGWAIGSDPSVVVIDKGAGASIDSSTLSHKVVAVPFGQNGLMAGLALQGSKITTYNPN